MPKSRASTPQLTLQGGKYVLTDMGSTNGTFVNGQRITGAHVLVPGEVISLGEQITLLFESLSHVDPNATMLSVSARPGAGQPARPTAPAAAPLPVPPPPRGYAGQVPAGPDPNAAEPVPAATNNRTLIIVAVVLLVLMCCCVFGLFLYDYINLWCSPLTSWLVPLLGGVCP